MAKPLEHNPNSTQNTASTKQYPDENAPQKGTSTKKKRFMPPALGETCFGENERLPGQSKLTHLPLHTAHFDIEDFITYHLYYIWNWRMLFHLNKAYSPNIRFHGGNGREYYGIGAVHSFILSFLALFPDAMMQLDDIYWMGNEEEVYLVAVRWSLFGSHSGYGIYGMSTHKPIHMLGVSQYRINDEKIIEEWTLFNELEILMRLER